MSTQFNVGDAVRETADTFKKDQALASLFDAIDPNFSAQFTAPRTGTVVAVGFIDEIGENGYTVTLDADSHDGDDPEGWFYTTGELELVPSFADAT